MLRCIFLVTLFLAVVQAKIKPQPDRRPKNKPREDNNATFDTNGFIIGGQQTTINQYPYQVSLRKPYDHICGGAIISVDYILTAAHCVQYSGISQGLAFNRNNFEYVVQAGSTDRTTGGTLFWVYNILSHPLYNPSTVVNDIAIIDVWGRYTFSATIKPILLPLANLAVTNGQAGTITGWGVYSYQLSWTGFQGVLPTQLQAATMYTYNNNICESFYQTVLSDGKVCLRSSSGQSGACGGDSGGPFAVGNTLIGLTSYGWNSMLFNTCNVSAPSIYTRVSYYRTWIKQTAGI